MHSAARFTLVLAVVKPALVSQIRDITEAGGESVLVCPDLDLPHAGCVNQHTAIRQQAELTESCGMATAAVGCTYSTRIKIVMAKQVIGNGRFADT